MITDILWVIFGLTLILLGANWLTDCASSLAKRMGVSELVVGLTVVAFGTSAPELAISIISAIGGNAPLAIGNVVGSNTLNILLIIGVTAIVRPIRVEKTVMSTEIPIVILSAVVMLILGNSNLLDGVAPLSGGQITRVDGILLLIAFGLYLRHALLSARNAPESARPAEDKSADKTAEMPVWKAIVGVIVGLVWLVYGGDKFVDGATGVASALGVSDAIIGLTIVALGTSLPELATSVVAAAKGRPGLAIGNVIGSNILNILLVLGAAATIHPLPFGGIGNLDLMVMVGASILFWISGWIIGHRTITRIEGIIFVALYAAYTTALIVAA